MSRRKRASAEVECAFAEESEHLRGRGRSERKAREPKRAAVERWLWGTAIKAKYNRRLRIKNTPVGRVAERLRVTFMRAGVLQSWRLVTDGNVWKREREVKKRRW